MRRTTSTNAKPFKVMDERRRRRIESSRLFACRERRRRRRRRHRRQRRVVCKETYESEIGRRDIATHIARTTRGSNVQA